MGALPPSFATAASNQSVDFPALPPQVIAVAPTGTTPSETAMSWSTQPTVATLVGSLVIVVSPKVCLMVTGKAPCSAAPWDAAPDVAPAEVEPELVEPAPEPQAARVRAEVSVAEVSTSRERRVRGTRGPIVGKARLS